MYSKKEVEEATLKYFNGDTLATNVWIDKYCLKDSEGNLYEKTPYDMHVRIAKELARIELKYPNPLSYDEIFELLDKFNTIIPGGSILFGCGNNYAVSSLGNCFVIGNTSDSYGGILATDEEQVQLMKRRGGVGHDISHLRPKLSPVSNSAKTSTGAVSFMPRYSNSTREVAQDGRRGALLLSMNIEHPDIDDFIESKDDLTKITGANISVKISDLFMDSLFENIQNSNTPEMINRKTNAKWTKLIHQACKTAEPGVLFIDTIIRESPADCYSKFGYRTVSTNPCGEIPLCPYDSCRLLSINLTSFVDKPFTSEAKINWPRFERAVFIAQKLMDDIVDLEHEKIKAILDKIKNDNEPDEIKFRERNLWLKIEEKLINGRRTGLSGIGFADLAAMLDIKYDNSKDLAELVYKRLSIESYKSSIVMASDRGAFPIWDSMLDLNSPFVNRVLAELDPIYNEMFTETGRRNIANLTIPPSGTLAIEAGITSGIEPLYKAIHKRRRKVNADHPNKSFQDKTGDWWEEYIVIHPGFKKWYIINSGCEHCPEVALDRLLSASDKEFDEIIKMSPYANSEYDQIDPIKKIEMIGAVQKWIDHAISQTLNLPADTSEKTVSDIYIKAHNCGLKGITVYVDGSRDGVLSSSKEKHEEFHQHNAPKRPKTLICDIRKVMIKGKEWIVCIGLYDNKPFEVFAFENKWNFFEKNTIYSGSITKVNSGQYNLNIKDIALIENITGEMTQGEEDRTRMISTSLRHGADVKFIIEQLNKSKNVDITSFSKAIARSLKHYIKNGEVSSEKCPICNGEIIYVDGCKECSSCGEYSKCG